MISINFGESLINALYLKEVKQVDLAKAIGVSKHQISVWTRRKRADVATIDKVANGLDMRPSEFIALGEEL
jgi:transcriptional regulator with XRE-family HTH domain